MNTNTNLLSAVFLSVLLFTACKEEKLSPLESSGTPPGPVSNVTVENLPGGALISYDIPNDVNLHYVKAVYQTNAETTREAKAYRSINHLVVEGFGRTGEYEVILTAVAQSEHESEPITVTINPLTPPVLKVRESLETLQDFGGINIQFQNEDEEDLVIAVITPDHAGEWVSADNFYSSLREGSFTARGFEAEPRTFGIYVRDRWENYSDTLITEVTPLREVELNKALFADARFPGEPVPPNPSQDLHTIWNGIIPTAGNMVISGSFFLVGAASPAEMRGLPMSFTIDLGQTAQLSRMKVWPRFSNSAGNPLSYVQNGGPNPRRFEIYGSTERRSAAWEDWELLGSFESIRPSGLPLGEIAQEDIDHFLAGEDFIFPVDTPPVRYIRWLVRDTWVATEGNNEATFNMNEMSVWGDVHEEHR